ncbi:MAG: SGNH/GDSL hydrolase family protein [Puniceicoccaceae bacterium]
MKRAILKTSWALLAACFCFTSLNGASKEEKAWAELVGRDVTKGAFAYVKNNKKLPNIFIYGDSISIGFTPTARSALDGKANVYRLHTNGGDSSSFIPKMEALKAAMDPHCDFKFDIIQFNVGLHDLKYLNEKRQLDLNGKQVTSLGKYAANLRKIVEWLKETYPEAKLVFCTTTAVPVDSAGRKPGDSVRYNMVARKVLSSYPEVIINDLFAFSRDHAVHGNVHFQKNQHHLDQGKYVAAFLYNELQKK